MQLRNLKVLFPKKKEASYIQKGISFKSFVGHSRAFTIWPFFLFPYFVPTLYIYLPYPKYITSICIPHLFSLPRIYAHNKILFIFQA